MNKFWKFMDDAMLILSIVLEEISVILLVNYLVGLLGEKAFAYLEGWAAFSIFIIFLVLKLIVKAGVEVFKEDDSNE